jgi:Ca-activated chloride channel family protein
MQWSGQRRDTLRYAEVDTAPRLFESLLAPNKTAFSAGYTDKVTLFSDFTNDPMELARKLRMAPGTPLYGPSALYSAIVWACGTELSPMPGRKVLVLVADGHDNASSTKGAVAVRAALQNNTVIYVISLVPANPFYKEIPSLGRDADKILKELAKKTGGNVIPVRSQAEMGAAFELVSKELRSQYALGYHPTKIARDGKFRKVKIQTTQKDLRVVSREGYYALTN